MSECSQQSLANTAWAFANLGMVDSPLLAAIASAAINICGEFVVQGISNLAWAFARCLFLDSELMDAVATKFVGSLGSG